MFYAPPLQPLLLWQSVSLFWLWGLLSPRYPLVAIAMACLCLYLDTRLRSWASFCMAIALFMVGFFAIIYSLPPRPPLPAWAIHNTVPVKALLEGEITRVQSLSDERLRIFLKNVRPVHMPQEEPLPGFMVWTWEQPIHKGGVKKGFPLAGQRVRITAKVRDTISSYNWTGADLGFYWQAQGVLWRIWSRGDYGEPQIFGKARVLAEQRLHVLQLLEQALFVEELDSASLVEQARAFLPALLMGERFFLTQNTLDKMQAASLIHSLALSGQHLSVVGVLALFFVFVLCLFFPSIFLYIPRRKLVGWLSLPLALVYLWLGDAPPSLLRAFCMLFIAFMLFYRCSIMSMGHILLYAVLCITVYWPLSIYTVGLQLSALCIFSICLVLPLCRRLQAKRVMVWRAAKGSKRTRIRGFVDTSKCVFWKIFDMFLISLAIQLVLLPIFLLYFPPSGMWFVLNVLWLPVLAVWVLPLAVLGLLLAFTPYAVLAQNVLYTAAVPCAYLLQLLTWMQEQNLLWFSAVLRPHASSVVAWLCLMLALALLPGRVSFKAIFEGRVILPSSIKKLCILAACLMCIAPVSRYMTYIKGNVSVEMLDVGQGQAILVTLPGGQKILIDGGGSVSPRFDPGTDSVLPRLVYNDAPRLWAAINSHPDMEHLRGLIHILPHMRVSHFYDNGEKFSQKEQMLWEKYTALKPLPPRQALHAGMEIPLPTFTYGGESSYVLEVLWPPEQKKERGRQKLTRNNASLILRLVQITDHERKGLVLLCGDAETATLQAVLHSGQDVSAQVLIVSHHGSKDSFLPEFYEKVAPHVALASAGRYNAYGHPHSLVREALLAQYSFFFSTSEEGAVRVTWDKGLNLQTAHKNEAVRYLLF